MPVNRTGPLAVRCGGQGQSRSRVGKAEGFAVQQVEYLLVLFYIYFYRLSNQVPDLITSKTNTKVKTELANMLAIC